MTQSDDRSPNCTHIVNATDQSFQQDVIDASSEQLILVDCWASWCEPCKSLMPTLEELAYHYDGDFTLVKINTEIAPATAQTLGVTTLPTVFAIYDGVVMDQFQGILEKNDIIHWIENLMSQIVFNKALANESDDPSGSERVYRELCAKRDNPDPVMIALARVSTTLGRHDEAFEIIDALERERGYLEPEAQQVKALIELVRPNHDLDELRNQAIQHPDDLEFKLQLAQGLAAIQEYEESFAIALELVKQDKSSTGDSAKEFLLGAFMALDDESDLVHHTRRKLAMLMY